MCGKSRKEWGRGKGEGKGACGLKSEKESDRVARALANRGGRRAKRARRGALRAGGGGGGGFGPGREREGLSGSGKEEGKRLLILALISLSAKNVKA